MINNLKVLALIPARGGSKGIKDKNIVDVCGKPLIAYSIIAAQKSKYIDDVIITTDSEKIKEVAEKYGADVPFLRPAELATDNAKTIDAVMHSINTLKELGRDYDILILLQPTCPLRTIDDINNSLELFVSKNYTSLVSVNRVSEHPILMRKIKEDGIMENLLNLPSTVRRQDMPPIYKVNGSIYINLINELNNDTSLNDNPLAYITMEEHSVDIDNISDIERVKRYLNNNE